MENTVIPIRGSVEGTVVSVICSAGFAVAGPPTVTCQNGGVWSNTPQCAKFGESFTGFTAEMYSILG